MHAGKGIDNLSSRPARTANDRTLSDSSLAPNAGGTEGGLALKSDYLSRADARPHGHERLYCSQWLGQFRPRHHMHLGLTFLRNRKGTGNQAQAFGLLQQSPAARLFLISGDRQLRVNSNLVELVPGLGFADRPMDLDFQICVFKLGIFCEGPERGGVTTGDRAE